MFSVRKIIKDLGVIALVICMVLVNTGLINAIAIINIPYGVNTNNHIGRPEPRYSWYPSGNSDGNVVNHTGNTGLNETTFNDNTDGSRNWDALDGNFTNEYVVFKQDGTPVITQAGTPDDVEHEAFGIRQFARETSTSGLFDVVTNIRGNAPSTIRPIEIVIVADHSSSMDYKIGTGTAAKSRLTHMHAAINEVVTYLNKNIGPNLVYIGYVSYHYTVQKDSVISPKDISIVANKDALLKTGTNPTTGRGTFTQAALRYAADSMFTNTPGRDRMILLLTDGVPSLSNAITKATAGNGINTLTVLETTTGMNTENVGASNDQYDYSRSGTPKGQSSSTPLGDFATAYVRGKTGANYSYNNNFLATIFEAERIKNKGIKIAGIGIGILPTTTPDNYGFSEEELESKFKQMVSDERFISIPDGNISKLYGFILDEIRSQFSTIEHGTFTNTIGEQFILQGTPSLAFYNNGVRDTGNNFSATASIATSNRSFNVNDITLGHGQELVIKHQVRLNTEDINFNPDNWYFISNPAATTLKQNLTNTNFYQFAVPSGRGTPTSLTLTKNWTDFDNAREKRPESVVLEIGRYINDVRDKNWRANATLNASNNWTYTFKTLDINGTNKAFPQYNNYGVNFVYKIVSEVSSPYYSYKISDNGLSITNVLNPLLNFTKYSVYLDNNGNQVKTPFENVEFTLSNGSNTQTLTTDSNGRIENVILSLNTTYTLTETTPHGYVQAGPWTITTDGVGNVSIEEQSNILSGSVSKTNGVLDFSLYNVRDEMIRLKIVNFDRDFNRVLPGTTYQLRQSLTGDVLYTLVADEYGVLRNGANEYVALSFASEYFLTQVVDTTSYENHPHVWHVTTPNKYVISANAPPVVQAVAASDDLWLGTFGIRGYRHENINSIHKENTKPLVGLNDHITRNFGVSREVSVPISHVVSFEIYQGITYNFNILKVDGNTEALTPLTGVSFEVYQVYGNVKGFDSLEGLTLSENWRKNTLNNATLMSVEGKVSQSNLQRGQVYVFEEVSNLNPYFDLAQVVIVVYMDESEKIHVRYATINENELTFVELGQGIFRAYDKGFDQKKNTLTFANFEPDYRFNFTLNKVDGATNQALNNVVFTLRTSQRDALLNDALSNTFLSNLNNFTTSSLTVDSTKTLELTQGFFYVFTENLAANKFYDVPSLSFAIYMDHHGVIKFSFLNHVYDAAGVLNGFTLLEDTPSNQNAPVITQQNLLTVNPIPGKISLTFNNFRTTNLLKYGLALTKVNATNQILSGVGFELLGSNDHYVLSMSNEAFLAFIKGQTFTSVNDKLVTGANGQLSIDSLVQGRVYRLKETSPIGFYALSDVNVYVHMDENQTLHVWFVDSQGLVNNKTYSVENNVISFNFVNELRTLVPYTFTLTKVDARYNTQFVEASFNLYASNAYNITASEFTSAFNSAVFTQVEGVYKSSKVDGKVNFSNLLPGKIYKIVESDAGRHTKSTDAILVYKDEAGNVNVYRLNGTTLESITKSEYYLADTDNNALTLTWKNTKEMLPYSFNLLKLGNDGQTPLAGVTFSLSVLENGLDLGFATLNTLELRQFALTDRNVVTSNTAYTINNLQQGNIYLLQEVSVPTWYDKATQVILVHKNYQDQLVVRFGTVNAGVITLTNTSKYQVASTTVDLAWKNFINLENYEFVISKVDGVHNNLVDGVHNNLFVDATFSVYESNGFVTRGNFGLSSLTNLTKRESTYSTIFNDKVNTGRVVIPKLVQGTVYKIVETDVQDRYAMATQVIVVYKDEAGLVSVKTIINDALVDIASSAYYVADSDNNALTLTWQNNKDLQPYTLTIQKVDGTNPNIPLNASFNVYRRASNFVNFVLSDTYLNNGEFTLVGTSTTDENGLLDIKLSPYYIYKIVEESTQERYLTAKDVAIISYRSYESEQVITRFADITTSGLTLRETNPAYVLNGFVNNRLVWQNFKEMLNFTLDLEKVSSVFNTRHLEASFTLSRVEDTNFARRNNYDVNQLSFIGGTTLQTKEGKIPTQTLNQAYIYKLSELEQPDGYELSGLNVVLYKDYSDVLQVKFYVLEEGKLVPASDDLVNRYIVKQTNDGSHLSFVFANVQVMDDFGLELTKVDQLFNTTLLDASFLVQSASIDFTRLGEPFNLSSFNFNEGTIVETVDGTLSITDLNQAYIYKISEKVQPEGYKLSDTVIVAYKDYEDVLRVRFFSPSENGLVQTNTPVNIVSKAIANNTISIVFDNERIMQPFNLTLNKVSSVFNDRLLNAGFTLYTSVLDYTKDLDVLNVTWGEGVPLTSTTTGVFNLNLKQGYIYRLVESSAPNGYVKSSLELIIYKGYFDSEPTFKYIMPGENGRAVVETNPYTSISNNVITFRNVQETSTFDFELSKVDGRYNEVVIDGAVFGLSRAPINYGLVGDDFILPTTFGDVEQKTTGEGGLISLTRLEQGYVYKLVELEPAPLYVLPSESVSIVFYKDYDGGLHIHFFDEDGNLVDSDYIVEYNTTDTISVTKANFRGTIEHQLNISKLDSETNAPLAGVEFTIEYYETEELIATGITNVYGLVEWDNDVVLRSNGQYLLRETTIPDGYNQAGPWRIVIDYFDDGADFEYGEFSDFITITPEEKIYSKYRFNNVINLSILNIRQEQIRLRVANIDENFMTPLENTTFIVSSNENFFDILTTYNVRDIVTGGITGYEAIMYDIGFVTQTSNNGFIVFDTVNGDYELRLDFDRGYFIKQVDNVTGFSVLDYVWHIQTPTLEEFESYLPSLRLLAGPQSEVAPLPVPIALMRNVRSLMSNFEPDSMNFGIHVALHDLHGNILRPLTPEQDALTFTSTRDSAPNITYIDFSIFYGVNHNFTLNKVDGHDQSTPLQVTFDIYSLNETVGNMNVIGNVEDFVNIESIPNHFVLEERVNTNVQGYFSSDLRRGVLYKIEEIKAAEGYILPDVVILVYMDEGFVPHIRFAQENENGTLDVLNAEYVDEYIHFDKEAITLVFANFIEEDPYQERQVPPTPGPGSGDHIYRPYEVDDSNDRRNARIPNTGQDPRFILASIALLTSGLIIVRKKRRV